MPTFNDPSADAEEARQALRGLAHASRNIENPDTLYGIAGELLASTRSLEQSLAQLAQSCLTHQGRAAHDSGDRKLGSADAWAASDALRQAAIKIGQAEASLNQASGHLGRIAWQPDPAPQTRWVMIAYLEGEEADRMLDRIDQDGTDAVIEELRGFDYGEDTTRDAESNGHVYDELHTGMTEQQAVSDDYTLTYSRAFGNVALYRQDTAEATASGVPVWSGRGSAINSPATDAVREALQERQVRVRGDGSWFTPDRITEVKRNRGLER